MEPEPMDLATHPINSLLTLPERTTRPARRAVRESLPARSGITALLSTMSVVKGAAGPSQPTVNFSGAIFMDTAPRQCSNLPLLGCAFPRGALLRER
jgi:hypothetical protein